MLQSPSLHSEASFGLNGLHRTVLWVDKYLHDLVFLLGRFFQKSVKTAVPDAGNSPRALALMKLVEESEFGVGDENSFFGFCVR